ncbi:MAG: hypothetical protein V3U27_16365, partial [Candidatus Tectomicrobia bacterium]
MGYGVRVQVRLAWSLRLPWAKFGCIPVPGGGVIRMMLEQEMMAKIEAGLPLEKPSEMTDEYR